MIARYIILFLSGISVGFSVWLGVLDFRVAMLPDWAWRVNWIGRALARLGGAIVIGSIAKLVYHADNVPLTMDTLVYLIGLGAYALGTTLSLFVLHPAEHDRLNRRHK